MICVLEMTFKRNDAVRGYTDNIHLEFDCGKLSARKMLKMRFVVMDDDNIDAISGEGDYIHMRTCYMLRTSAGAPYGPCTRVYSLLP